MTKSHELQNDGLFFYVNKGAGLPTAQKLSSLDAAETRLTFTSPSDRQRRRNCSLSGHRCYKNNWSFAVSGLRGEARPAPTGGVVLLKLVDECSGAENGARRCWGGPLLPSLRTSPAHPSRMRREEEATAGRCVSPPPLFPSLLLWARAG